MPSTRRSFFRVVAAAAAAAAAASPGSVPVKGATTPTATPAAPPTPTPAPPDPRAEALVQLARERYGKFLSTEELSLLDDRVRALERRGARLRGVKLGNGEEPVAIFRAGRP
ncbi:MAG: hypothetical protein ABI682_17470 [Acidobacteriota bacterium]